LPFKMKPKSKTQTRTKLKHQNELFYLFFDVLFINQLFYLQS